MYVCVCRDCVKVQIHVHTRSVPVACVRLMVVVGRGARGRWWGRQVITGVGGIVTRTKRRERMRGGFPFVRVAYPCEHERKNREEKRERERERERQELEASKLKRSARRSLRLPKEFAYLTTFIIRVFAWQSLLRPRLQSTRIVQHDPRADFVCVGFRNFRNDSSRLFAIPKLSRGSIFSGWMSIWSI